MKLKNKLMQTRIIAVLMTIFTALAASGIATEGGIIANESGAISVVSAVIGSVVLVLVASALMNTTSTNAQEASTTLTTNGETGAASVVDQWTLGIAIAVFVAIFAFAL